MSAKPKVVLAGAEKTGLFIIGFLGWFLINGVVGGLVIWLSSIGNNTVQAVALMFNGLLLLANPAALVVLAFFPRGRWLAMGALAAIAVAFCIVLIVGASLAAICFSSLGKGNL